MNDIIFVPVKKYVYFDDEGNLLSVSNTNNSPGNFIEVSPADVENLISGKEFLHNYIVLFDTVEKSHVLKHRFNEEEFNFDINKQIYQIERKNNNRSDLIVYQDLKNKQWTFQLDSAIKDNVKNKSISFQQSLPFAITRYNDPNQLEKFFIITFLQLVENDVIIPFESDLELDQTALSVYTIKRLDTYHHEVIND